MTDKGKLYGAYYQPDQLRTVTKAIKKKGGVFKYPKVFQCDNGPEFKNEVTKLLKKNKVDI